ncbi:DNA repair exonuclease [Candidatus Parvarchaeota archaeon]|nr:DNA repair exonuclease [Candidatus Parvarchaeota archaeon]
MKFFHTGDSHIGNVYKNDRRNEDINLAFQEVIDKAINERIDFIVHSGDLFNEGNPSIRSLLFVTDQLNRLKAAGIKVFIIPGSHDIGIGEEKSILELFDRNGLLTNLGSSRYIENTGKEFKLRGEVYRNAFICGVMGKRSRVEDEIFKKLEVVFPERAVWIKIFLFHHTISALGEVFKDIDTESLPKGFNYYAAGHWHGHKEGITYSDGIIQYPGSTEYCDEKEIVDNPNRGFYSIEYDENGITKIEYCLLNVRKRKIIDIDVNNKKPAEVEKEIYAKLSKSDGEILVIKLTGRVNGKGSEIGLGSIKSASAELGYAYVSLNTSKMLGLEDLKNEFSNKDVSEIEKEFFMSRGYTQSQARIIKNLLNDTDMLKNKNGLRKLLEDLA